MWATHSTESGPHWRESHNLSTSLTHNPLYISIFNFSPSFHRFNSKTHLILLRTLVTRLSRILHAKIIYTPQIIAHQFFVCDMTTKFILYYYIYIYYYYYYIIHNTLSLCFLLNIETDRLGLVSSYHHELPIKPPLVYKTDIVCV